MSLGTENEQIEFKKSTSELKEGIQSLSSMLNKSGKGVLYFGVKNNGEIIGQLIGENTLRDISQAIANNIKPQIIPTIEAIYLEEKTFIKVTCEGNEKPYSAYGRYYIRSADEDREITPEQLRKIMLENNGQSSMIEVEALNQNLTFNVLKSLFLNKNYTLDNNTFRQNFKFYTKNNRYNLLAQLLADQNDTSIKVVTFAGKDKTKLIKRTEYGYKCLLLAAQQVLDYIEALNETFVEINGAQRQETKLFDFLCFREAWLNACLHNSWYKMIPPAVYIFNDRIEIVSTGGLPLDYSLEEFYMGISHPINMELQKIMGQLDYIEQTGHGVPLIINKYGKEAFTINENSIIVTIYFSHNLSYFELDTKSLKGNYKRVFELIKDNPTITSEKLEIETQLSKTMVYNILKKLKEMNYIERIGSKKTGCWEIINLNKTKN